MKDTFKTIDKPSPEVLFKDKNSKFFGYAFPVSNEVDIKQYLEELKKAHHQARHWCYAYQIGKSKDDLRFRANDDGEPNNSAGMPIYGQIQSYDLTNVLVVVVRYFGGVKLGVSGLINAYRTGAKYALEASSIITKVIREEYLLTFDYKDMNKVMRIIKEKKLTVKHQKMELSCEMIIAVRLKESEMVRKIFDVLYEVKLRKLND